MAFLRDIIEQFLGVLVYKPKGYHYEPVDKRGSTTYPPEESGPSDLAIYGGACLLIICCCKLLKKVFKG